MTIFGDQLYQYGGSPVGGIFTTGKVWFVKPSSGSDANTGKRPDQAVKTVAKAYSLATANKNDVIYIVSESNTGSGTTDYQSSTLTFSKDLTHVAGVCAPSVVSQRSRIAQLSTATAVSPLVLVSGDAGIYQNFSIFHGVADATSLLACTVTGTRNYFENIHFAGIGHATMSATGSASLKLDACEENLFKRCVIGVDTIDTDGDGSNMIVDNAATRNKFEDCLFNLWITATAAQHVLLTGTDSVDRWLWFKDCTFMSQSVNKTVDMAEVFDISTGQTQGSIILQNCAAYNNGGAPGWTAGTEGIIWANMVAATASAAGGFGTNL
jgi:hypothetical protein